MKMENNPDNSDTNRALGEDILYRGHGARIEMRLADSKWTIPGVGIVSDARLDAGLRALGRY